MNVVRSRHWLAAAVLLLLLVACDQLTPPSPTTTPLPLPTPPRFAPAAGEAVPLRKCIASGGGNEMIPVIPIVDCQYVWGAYVINRPGVESIPLLSSPEAGLPDVTTMDNLFAAGQPLGTRYLLVGNECSIEAQCNTAPRDMAVYWRQVITAYDADFILGGDFSDEIAIDWLEETMESYRSLYGDFPERAGFAFHLYPKQSPHDWAPSTLTAADAFDQLDNIRRFIAQYGRPDDLVFVTEWGCLVPNPCDRSGFLRNYMIDVLQCFNTPSCGAFVNRYYYFTDIVLNGVQWPWLWLYNFAADGSVGNLKPLGVLYRDWQPAPVWKPDHSLYLAFIQR